VVLREAHGLSCGASAMPVRVHSSEGSGRILAAMHFRPECEHGKPSQEAIHCRLCLYPDFTHCTWEAVNADMRITLGDSVVQLPPRRVLVTVIRRVSKVCALVALGVAATGCVIAPYGYGWHGHGRYGGGDRHYAPPNDNYYGGSEAPRDEPHRGRR